MQSSDARILRGAAIPSALAGVAATLVGLLVAGSKGALGAALGSVTVIVFFSISLVAVSYASKVSPQAMFGAAIFSYVGKLIVLFALLGLFRDATAWHPKVFAWTVVALTLIWLGVETRALIKLKIPYVDDPVPAGGPPRGMGTAVPGGDGAGGSTERSP